MKNSTMCVKREVKLQIVKTWIGCFKYEVQKWKL